MDQPLKLKVYLQDGKIFPACPDSRLVCQLLQRDYLTTFDIKIITDAGHSVVFVNPTSRE